MFKRIKIAAYAMLSAFNVSLVGQLKANEILALLLAPFTFKVNDLKDYPFYRKIIYALIALLLFQFITDVFVIHNTAQNFLRGWAGTIMSILSFVVLFKLLDTEAAVLTFILWTMIRNIVATDDIVDSEMSYFKFKIVPIIASALQLLAVYLYRRGKMSLMLGAMVVGSLLCFANDARSSGMLFFLSAGIIWILSRNFRITRQKLFVFALLGAIVFEGCYVFYVNSVLRDGLGGGHSSSQLQRLDNPYNPFELLMTGRGETFAAFAAIGDKPLFGHGSWTKDKDLKYYKIVLSYQGDEGGEFDLQKADAVDRYIPSHSVLLGAWISCGIGGFIAVFLVCWYLMKMAFTLVVKAQASPLYPVYVMLTVSLLWAFLFSPFQHLRFSIPATGCILMNGYYDWLYGFEDDEDEENEDEPENEKEPYLTLN
ncbi:hypothetical protein [Chitinophaga japonensis]|nr:hypothetical protein [Chitinophaga japonensis]